MSAFTPLRRQADLLRYIAGYVEAHGGLSPSYREMAAGVGVASSSAVHSLLNGLEARGRVRRLPYRARAIELLEPVAIPRAADGAPVFFVPIRCGAASNSSRKEVS